MKKNGSLLKMIFSALFLALSYVLPFVTGQVPEIGNMLCPMHFPVILCGFFCGWQWGLVVGLIAPLFRSLTLGMPQLFPMAVCMALELASYGAVSGVMHRVLPRKKPYVYISLIASMVIGRVVWGFSMFICMGSTGTPFTFSSFIAGAFTNAIPGIIAQIILIPLLVILLDNPNIIKKRDLNVL